LIMSDPEKAVLVEGNDADTEDMEDEEDEQQTFNNKNNKTAQLLRDPEMLAALQGKLHALVLPPAVKRRIKALKKLQLDCTKIEAKFYEEVHALECKYFQQYVPYYEKREQIVNAVHEPTDDECEWPSDDEKADELTEEIKNKLQLGTGDKGDNSTVDAPGIPDFWLTIFKNVDLLANLVQEHDEPILKHLKDITIKFSKENPMGFTLEFHFSPNDHFTNEVLTKEYEMKCVPDEADPFSFEGPEIFRCKGCSIDWKKGKNITVKTIKKKQKHKSRGSVRTVTKTVQNDSFFNFFAPPPVPEDPEAEVEEETQDILTTDFEIGHYIREHIVPRAVLYFTGEALDDDDYDEEEEEGDEADDEEEEDEDDYKPHNKKQQQQQNPAE